MQLLRLRLGQHAERHAGLEPERFDALDHGANLIEIAILRRAPGGAHAEAAGAGVARGARFGEHLVERHQLLGIARRCRNGRSADNRRSPRGSRRS